MKEIFSKSSFPLTPGGNNYQWHDAETAFDLSQDGKYIIAITASAKDAAQNNGQDDDDLRVVINGYEFGKQEVHQDKVSWNGFGIAASWDGASLQGGSKTVYFFMSLAVGKHTIKFWADETPAIKVVRVLQIIEEQSGAIEDVIFDFHEKAPGQKTDVHGIPWKTFVFAPGFNIVKLADISANTESGKQKGGTDGDNIKVYVNGQIVGNPKAPTSDKYKNFFFSGDLSQGKKEALMIPGRDFLFNEQDVSIELWYDETPLLETVKFELDSKTAYEQPNTLKRRIIRLIEGRSLPFNLWDNWPTILDSVQTARDTAQHYAREQGFIEAGDGGEFRLLIEDNEPDAMRHFAWNVLLTRDFDDKAAEVITTNHEVFWMEIRNKKDLSRSNVQDMWNNKQGREFAIRYPDIEHFELFEIAKSEKKLIINLEDVTEEHRAEVQKIIDRAQ
ncbi:MAG: hypothetical protein O2904_03350 [bacterium]|nr:hypothetical protein [bacterium]